MIADFMIKYLRLTSIVTLSLSVCFFFASCDKDMSISLNNENIENLNLSSSDTLTAEVATVLMPNIPTSGTGRLLVGKVQQGPIGSLTASSYFRILPFNLSGELPNSAKFDSINLILRPSYGRYSFGDTTKSMTIVAHRLTKALETTTINSSMPGFPNPVYISGASIFGHQNFAYDANALGSVSFLPYMHKRDSVQIRLNDALGAELFQKIKTSDYVLNSAANFNDYFKGMVLVPDANSKSIVGFSDTLQVNVNYSYLGTDGLKKTGVKSFQMGDRSVQYNQMDADRSGTMFADLKANRPKPVSQTQGVSFVQGGAGIATKISFPGLAQFMRTPGFAINKAELIIELESSHFGHYIPAQTPILFIANNNIPVNYVMTPFGNSYQTGGYIPGNNTGRRGRYVFNMIQYIRSANDEGAQDKSLFLSLSPSELLRSGNTSILATENNQPLVKLNIVYTKFK